MGVTLNRAAFMTPVVRLLRTISVVDGLRICEKPTYIDCRERKRLCLNAIFFFYVDFCSLCHLFFSLVIERKMKCEITNIRRFEYQEVFLFFLTNFLYSFAVKEFANNIPFANKLFTVCPNLLQDNAER